MTDSAHSNWATDPRHALWCVTFTRNVTPADVLRRYGADPGSAQLRAHADTREFYERIMGAGTVLRVGLLGAWSFCYEDAGAAGSRPGLLSCLSQGTETLSLLKGGDGMNLLAVWRDGQREEVFEPGAFGRRPQKDHRLWDLVQQSTTGQPRIIAAFQAIARYTGVLLDDAKIAGPLLTACLADADRIPDPTPQPAHPSLPKDGNRPLGRSLGSFRPAGQEENRFQ